MDEQEEYWHETNPAVIFVIALQDLDQPHSCEDWGDKGIEGYPLIVEHPGTIFTWLHDSWNAFPTYAILDHTMTVRAKPWTYSNNSNTSPCDGSNDTIDNWNGGNANDFIAQLIEECGSLCEPCDQNDPNDSDGDGTGDDCHRSTTLHKLRHRKSPPPARKHRYPTIAVRQDQLTIAQK